MDDQAPVFADAGPLIILGRAGYLWLLRDLFGRVNITPVVKEEVLPGENRPAELAIAKAIADGYIVPVPTNPPEVSALPKHIHAGERSMIEAGLAMPGALLILDDADARKCASTFGIDHIGTIGIMLWAKELGLVPAIAKILEAAIDQGMYVAPSLVRDAIAKAGEQLPQSLEAKFAKRS